MADHSKIEWTDSTWTVTTGCTRVSDGCNQCYAVRQTHRCAGSNDPNVRARYAGLTVLNPKGERHFNGVVRCHQDALEAPLHWRKPRRVFVNSMSDLFHKGVPFEFIYKVFAVMALCPQHTFQVLTKRPEVMAECLTQTMCVKPPESLRAIEVCAAHRHIRYGADAIAEERSGGGCWREHYNNLWPLPNVWLGTSVENQEQADKRIPHLLKCPAAVRFLSVEPLLGPVDLRLSSVLLGNRGGVGNVNGSIVTFPGVDWVIVGGESGHGARQCPTEWIKSIVDQCRAADTPCFVKQLGSKPVWVGALKFHPIKLKDSKGGDPSEWPAELRIRQMPRVAAPREEALS